MTADPTAIDTEDLTPDERRDDILDAVLMHVPFDGWTHAAIRAATRDLDLDPGLVELAFPRGIADMLAYYLERADARLAEELDRRNLGNMRIRERIATAVMTRLEQAEGEKEAVQRTLVTLALPAYARLAARSLWRTADVMWRAAGDTSTDYNFYTKRTILSGVYSSTLLYWLSDTSPDHEDTRGYLDRRIDNVMQFEKVKAQLIKSRETMPSLTRFLGRLRYPAR